MSYLYNPNFAFSDLLQRFDLTGINSSTFDNIIVNNSEQFNNLTPNKLVSTDSNSFLVSHTLHGTTNQIIITAGSTGTTFSTPQDINTNSNVRFNGVSGTSGTVIAITGTTLTYTNARIDNLTIIGISGTYGNFAGSNISGLSGNTLSYNTGLITSITGTTAIYTNISGTTGNISTIIGTTGNITAINGTTANYTTMVFNDAYGTNSIQLFNPVNPLFTFGSTLSFNSFDGKNWDFLQPFNSGYFRIRDRSSLFTTVVQLANGYLGFTGMHVNGANTNTLGFSGPNINTGLGNITSITGTTLNYTNIRFTGASGSMLNCAGSNITGISGSTLIYTNADITNLNITGISCSYVNAGGANITGISGSTLTYTNANITNLFLTVISCSYGNFSGSNISVISGATLKYTKAIFGDNTLNPLGAVQIALGADSSGSNSSNQLAFNYRTGGYPHFIRTRHNTAIDAGNAFDFFTNTSSTSTGSTFVYLGNTLACSITAVGVGIGTTSPAYKLDVIGDARTHGLTANGITCYNLTSLGSITLATNNNTGLNYFWEESISNTLTGIWATPINITITATRLNKKITLSFTQALDTTNSSSYFSLGTVLATKYTPSERTTGFFMSYDGGKAPIKQMGHIQIENTGAINFYQSVYQNSFSNAQTCGIAEQFSITYYVS